MDSKHLKIAVLILRLALGGLFLYAGMNKLLNDFDSSGYLTNTVSGPFSETFKSMANNSVVNFLVIFGEIAIGLALELGIFIRLAAVSGILMMVLYYLSTIPQENGPISQHIIYICCFIVLFAAGAGRFLGIDKQLEENNIVKLRWNIFKYLLG